MVSWHWPFWFGDWLHSLSLSKAIDALGESILFNQLRPSHPVLRLGGERGVAAFVEVQRNDLRNAVAPHVQRLAVLQTLKECDLLLVHLEQLCITLPIERCVFQEQKRCAGVHDAVGVGPKVIGGLANHGDAAKVLANGLDGSESAVKQLLVLHRREDLFDEDVLGNAEICRVIENVVDAPEEPYHQRLDQVGILFIVHALEVEALQARERETVFDVVKDGVIDAFPNPLRQIAVEFLRQKQIGQAAVLRIEQVHILHGLVDHIIVFRLQLCAAVGEQKLDK